MTKSNKRINTNGMYKYNFVIETLYHINTKLNGMHPSKKFANAVNTREITKISRGNLDLIIKFLLSISVVSDVCVAVAKNSNIRKPTK